MPVTFHNFSKSTLAGDRPTKKSSFATIANAIKEAGSNPTSAVRALQSFPHYGIKQRKVKPVGMPKKIA